MKVPFLTPQSIERSALSLIAAYENSFGKIASPPIPVEEIIECHLQLDFYIDDLKSSFGSDDVLGATWIAERKVRVDESLDPTVYPAKEGRYRFTLAHETGHWELHRPLLEAHAGQGVLFASETQPPVVCRTSASKEPMEWQADTFAGYLLMPEEMLRRAWREIFGSTDPYLAASEIAATSATWSLAEDRTPTVAVAREMAEVFKVSGQAMQIRLTGLGLIRTQAPPPSLFTSVSK